MTDSRQRRFSPEVRERAVRLVQQHQGDHPSEWAAITSIAAKIGCTAETLRSWLRHARSMLLDVGGAHSITSAALDSGINHFGLFARQYRAAFGELPSAVNRNRSGTPAVTSSTLLRGLEIWRAGGVPIDANRDPTPNKILQALTKAYAGFVGGPISVLIHMQCQFQMYTSTYWQRRLRVPASPLTCDKNASATLPGRFCVSGSAKRRIPPSSRTAQWLPISGAGSTARWLAARARPRGQAAHRTVR